MEENKNVWKTGFNSGLVIGLILIIYSLILFIAGYNIYQSFGWVSYLILIGGIVWAHRKFKDEGDGYMSYGEGLGLGAIASGVAGAFNGIFIFLYTSFVDPEFFANMMEEIRIQFEDQGFSEEQIDQMMNMTETVQSPAFQLFGTLFGYLFLGFIFSLIIAAITKKKNPAEEI